MGKSETSQGEAAALRAELEQARAEIASLRARDAAAVPAVAKAAVAEAKNRDVIGRDLEQGARREVQLAPAPRPVPVGAAFATLFGGTLSVIGYLMLAFSSIFVWVFVMQSELVTPFEFSGRKVVVSGTVTGVSYTGSSVNDVPILAVHAAFEAPATLHYSVAPGGTLEAVGYVSAFDARSVKVGGMVEVEYVVARPQTARIVGMSSKAFPAFVAFVLIFPAVALLMLLPELLDGVKKLKLFRHGVISHGALVEAGRPTGTVVNGRPVMEYVFEFTPAPAAAAATGTREGDKYSRLATRVSHKGLNNYAVLNEAWEPVLYLPSEPSVAALLDGLPGGTYVNADGNFEAPPKAFLYVLPPLTVVLVNWLCKLGSDALS